MIEQGTHQIERKVTAILKILHDSATPLGGRAIAQRLKELGIDLGERAVRYHLKIMDEKGLTEQMGSHSGRRITQSGLEELRSALVCDKVGFTTDKLELLAYLTSFHPAERSGFVPINVSLFSKKDFPLALKIMADIFRTGLCPSRLVSIAGEGERLGETIIPEEKVGFATVSSAAVCGVMLKAGIPIDFRFGGILQFRDRRPTRFIDLIEYHSSTVDPFEMFVAAKMTSVCHIAQDGNGNMLASFQELPLPSRPAAERVIESLRASGLCSSAFLGKANEPLYEIPVRPNKVGLVVPSGLNAAAAVAEHNISVITKATSGVISFEKLTDFWNLLPEVPFI